MKRGVMSIIMAPMSTIIKKVFKARLILIIIIQIGGFWAKKYGKSILIKKNGKT